MKRLARSLKYIAGILLIAATSAGVYLFLHKTPVVPAKFTKVTTFVIFYPTKSSGAAINQASFKYGTDSKVLSFLVSQSGINMTVAEQATPQGFIDIPQAYDKLIESLNGYAEFGSYYGTVNLTHPKEFNGQQSAALNAKGTLMFVHPTNGQLSQDQWKVFFNNLQTIQ